MILGAWAIDNIVKCLRTLVWSLGPIFKKPMWDCQLAILVWSSRGRWTPGVCLPTSLAYSVRSRPGRDLVSTSNVDGIWKTTPGLSWGLCMCVIPPRTHAHMRAHTPTHAFVYTQREGILWSSVSLFLRFQINSQFTGEVRTGQSWPWTSEQLLTKETGSHARMRTQSGNLSSEWGRVVICLFNFPLHRH